MVLLSSWSRLSDRTSVRQIAAITYGKAFEEVTGWERDKVALSLRQLARSGVIDYQSGRGHFARCTLSLTPVATRPNPGRVASEQHNPGSEANTSENGTFNPAARVGTSENSSENSSMLQKSASTTPSARAAEERELRQTTRGRIAARFADSFDSPQFTIWDALAVVKRFEPYGDLQLGIDTIIGQKLPAARSPQYVINALEQAYPRARGVAA